MVGESHSEPSFPKELASNRPLWMIGGVEKLPYKKNIAHWMIVTSKCPQLALSLWTQVFCSVVDHPWGCQGSLTPQEHSGQFSLPYGTEPGRSWPNALQEKSVRRKAGRRGLLKVGALKCRVQRSYGQNKKTKQLRRKEQLTEQKEKIKESPKEKEEVWRVEGYRQTHPFTVCCPWEPKAFWVKGVSYVGVVRLVTLTWFHLLCIILWCWYWKGFYSFSFNPLTVRLKKEMTKTQNRLGSGFR